MSISPTFSQTPKPLYCAVIFVSQHSNGNQTYAKMTEKMVELAVCQTGFLDIESVRGANGSGITVSYWNSTEAITSWRSNIEHLAAQEIGTQAWHEHYEIKVAQVEHVYIEPPL